MNTAKDNPLAHMIESLSIHNAISDKDLDSLYHLPYHLDYFESGSYILRDGDMPDQCRVLVSGIAYRHKISAMGLRQIVAIHMPGEILDLQQLYIDISDSNVQTLIGCEIATISHAALRQLVAESYSIGNAIVASMLMELSSAREWMLNIGRREGRTRIAHFICEFAYKSNAIESLAGQVYNLPMTQEQMGDALGLTAVHINRMLKDLAREGLIVRVKHGVAIPDWKRLTQVAGFNSRYLHLKN